MSFYILAEDFVQGIVGPFDTESEARVHLNFQRDRGDAGAKTASIVNEEVAKLEWAWNVNRCTPEEDKALVVPHNLPAAEIARMSATDEDYRTVYVVQTCVNYVTLDAEHVEDAREYAEHIVHYLVDADALPHLVWLQEQVADPQDAYDRALLQYVLDNGESIKTEDLNN